MEPIGLAADPDYLGIIERAHRKAAGENNFCYAAVTYSPGSELYRLAIVRKYVSGYWPISDDYFIGSERETKNKATDLNRDRISLTPREAARIVATSMAAPSIAA